MTRTNANGAFSFPLRSGSQVRTWTLRVVAKGGPPSAPVVLTVHG